MTYAFKRQRDARNAAAIARQRPPSTIGKPDNPGRGSSWLAKAPAGGIPAESGQPGYADCEIYSVVNGQVVAMPSGTGTLTIEVFNLAATDIPEGDIVPVWQVGGVFVANGPAALDCKRICEECPPYSTENGGCPSGPLPGNCCPSSMCLWTSEAITNMAEYNGKTQFEPSSYFDEQVDICSFLVELADGQGAGDPNKIQHKLEYLVDYGWVIKWPGSGSDPSLWLREWPARSDTPCSGSFTLTQGGNSNPDAGLYPSVTFDVAGEACAGCCQNDDCEYTKDHIAGLLVDFQDGRTFTQNGASYLAPGAPCEWTVPITDSDAVETEVTVLRSTPTTWTVSYTFGNWRTTSFSGCSGTVNLTPNFGVTGVASFDANGVACAETDGFGTAFMTANPDLASRRGCKCKDAVAIMNKLPPEKLRSRITLLAKLFYKPGGPSLVHITQRIEAFLDEV